MTDICNDDSLFGNTFKEKNKNLEEIKEIPNFNFDSKTLSSAVSICDYGHCQINTNLYSNINTDIDFDQINSMTNIINNEVSFLERESLTTFNLTSKIEIFEKKG